MLLVVAIVATLVITAAAQAKATKFTFNDVTYPNGTTGEITASVENTNKSHVWYCGYFGDDFQESLGYYEQFSDTQIEADAAAVEQFCLAHFDQREQ